MADRPQYYGVNFDTLRKALFIIFFGERDGECDDFNSPLYKYIIPLQGNFENPIKGESKDTYIMYWIEQDESLTQDSYVRLDGVDYNQQNCIADILVRFIGVEAEQMCKVFRHLCKRKNVADIWYDCCDAEKFLFTSPIIPRRLEYSGKTNNIAFDTRFRLHYNETIPTGWKPLLSINMKVEGNLKVESSVSL